MKFTLEIELGNDAMQTGRDVAEDLIEAARKVHKEHGNGKVKLEDNRKVMDKNGNSVGTWRFEKE